MADTPSRTRLDTMIEGLQAAPIVAPGSEVGTAERYLESLIEFLGMVPSDVELQRIENRFKTLADIVSRASEGLDEPTARNAYQELFTDEDRKRFEKCFGWAMDL